MDTITEQFVYQLKTNGYSLTRPRRAVFSCLLNAVNPLSIQEIVAHTAADIHFVSVYRSVDVLLKAGIITQVSIGFKSVFELSESFKPHHHHATCEVCHRSFPISDVRIEKLMRQLTRQAGLHPTKHNFEAYGICSSCR